MALAPMPARHATIASDPTPASSAKRVIGPSVPKQTAATTISPAPEPPARPGAGASRHRLPTS